MNPVGAGMGIVPVFAVQEAIAMGLMVLAEDEHAVDTLLARVDMYATEESRTGKKRALRAVLDPRSDECVTVRPSLPFPYGAVRLPWVSVLDQGGGEDGSALTFGNLVHDAFDYHGPDQEVWLTRTIGSGEDTTVQVAIWDDVPERSHLLHAAVRWALLQQTQRMYERGVLGVGVRVGGSATDLDPRVAYLPMLNVTIRWTLLQQHRRKVPNRFSRTSTTVSN